MSGDHRPALLSRSRILTSLAGFLALLLAMILTPLPALAAGSRPGAGPENRSIPQAGENAALTEPIQEKPLSSRVRSRAYNKPEAKITKPHKNEHVEGTIHIKGTADTRDFTKYTISYSPVSNPEQQTPIAESFEPVHNGKLADWDTTAVPDGDYSLTLTVFDSGGPDAVDSVEVRLDNQPPALSFSSPGSEGVVVSPFDITGTVADAHLKSWKLKAESIPARLCSHLDGSTVNERTGEAGRLEGDPDYPNARFSSGLHIGQGQGLTYPRDHNIEKESGTVKVWLIPDWSGGEQSEHLLFSTRTADFSNPTDCLKLSKIPEGLSFSAYDHAGGVKTTTIPTTEANLPAGIPALIAATWDSGDIGLYLNGVASTDVQGGGTGIISEMGNKLYVGFYPEAGLEADATFDELSIYDYARPVSAIRADYLAESPKTLGDTKTTIARGEDPVDNSLLGTATVEDSPAEAVLLFLEARDDFNLKSNIEERVFTDNPDPAAIISSPGEGEQVSGLVTVEGSCFDMDLSSWTLSAKPGDASSPGVWTPIASGNEAVWRGGIADWDTSAYSGPASLKLEVIDSHGKTSVETRTVYVLSAGPLTADIVSPAEGQAIDSPFQVTGTASGANFEGYSLEYREKSPSFLCHFNDNTRNERDADTGTITGSPAFQPGKFDSGLFIGSGDSLSYPTSGNITASSGTLAMWVTPDWSASSEGTHTLFSTEPTEFGSGLSISKEEGKILFSAFDSFGRPESVSAPLTDDDVRQGVPFHLAATWNEGDIRFYLNGVEHRPEGGQMGSGVVRWLGERLFVGSSADG
ncbi:MAG: LamG domain-containing protein, partial [Actinobacteria bacterium]|nr:LamG domain-containing protein [Actinomycetota bacterium]